MYERDIRTDRRTPHDGIGHAYAERREAKIHVVLKLLIIFCQEYALCSLVRPTAMK